MRSNFAQFEVPKSISAQELDNYLHKGWFRMHQSIFTTHFLCFNQQFYNAVWLRVGLKNYVVGKKQKELYKRNSALKVLIGQAEITPAHEHLYKIYRQSISFSVAESLQDLLMANTLKNRYNTYLVSLYDNEMLVATGVFDLGATAAAGISCFYHPEYKKQSLGRYLIFLKMDFCRSLGMHYFYPGYAVPGYDAFDYKLKIGTATLEYLALESNQWVPYSQLTTKELPLEKMTERLKALQKLLSTILIPTSFHYYRFFDANLDSFYAGVGLFDYPVFLYCHPISENVGIRVIAFDVRNNLYHLIPCRSLFSVGSYSQHEEIFAAELLQAGPPMFSSALPEDFKAVLLAYL
jgi:arginyl-tRNA--protein-N-Asp/Glu arginylyltransferase